LKKPENTGYFSGPANVQRVLLCQLETYDPLLPERRFLELPRCTDNSSDETLTRLISSCYCVRTRYKIQRLTIRDNNSGRAAGKMIALYSIRK
jgi:hypothetical protein